MDIKYENLHSYIYSLKKKFTEIQENYEDAKMELEFEDAKYKDDENNIFSNARYKKLSKFIETEAQLYRIDDLRFGEIKKIINDLDLDIRNWQKSIKYRNMQGIEEAQRVYKSEKYYLRDMRIRLEYYSSILECLIDMENMEDHMLFQGKEISTEPEYEIFLLNKCILLNQIDYCSKKCAETVRELNNRVNNSNRFSGGFLYKLGELNFELQNYNSAQLFLNRAIKVLEDKSKDEMILGVDKCLVNDMLFSAYQLSVLGYEFCGEYDKAIYLLTENDINFEKWNSDRGAECAHNVVKIFDDNLMQYGGINALIYSSDNTDLAKYKRKNIIKWLDEIFKNNLFDSNIFCYAHKESNQLIFKYLVDIENKKLHDRIYNCKKGNKEKKEEVYQTNKILVENNNILYEYIHILAHCLNEYGVTCFQNINKYDERFVQRLILLGRALMLYVSDKLSIYKTCYATTYAEAGDFEIAKNELKCVLKDDKYINADVTTKAEIIFFTYLINSLDRIKSGNVYHFWKKNELYDRYLNYCYRSFDYDAIAHMKVYDFRHNMAFIMQQSDLGDMADFFFSFSDKKDDTGKTPYEKLVNEVYFQNTNRRLKCEFEKVKYMYHFLKGVFERFKNNYQFDSENENFNNGKILDYALKYMHFHNLLMEDSNNEEINYIVSSDINSISSVFPKIDVDINGIVSEYCDIIILNSEETKKEFIEKLTVIQNDKLNKLLFVVCENSVQFKQRLRNEKGIRVNKIKNIRFFESLEKGIYEFVILNTFFYIKNDFSDPKNIFVLTPIDTAKSCKYRVCSDIELILEGLSKEYLVTLDEPKNISIQYSAVAERFSNEEPWERQLNNSKLDKDISVIISLMYDKECNNNYNKYRYKYRVSDEWKEAVLFLPNSLIQILEDLYDDDRYDRIKVHKDCHSPRNNCSVQVVDKILNWKSFENTFDEITKSFPEINFSDVNNLFLWFGENGPFVSWRMVFVKNNTKSENIDKIKHIMCSSGRGLQFSAEKVLIGYNWPEPYDINEVGNFLFLCHSGNDDEVLKKELNEFFKAYDIPVWYDKDRFVNDKGWKRRIQSIIQNERCVGCILMITNKHFFDSEAIQYELLTIAKECERSESNIETTKADFAVIPVVYGLEDSQNGKSKFDKLKAMMRGSIDDVDAMMKIEKCIVPGKDKVITYLNENQSLTEYTNLEMEEGRNGSILKACKELGLNFKEDCYEKDHSGCR